MSNVLAKVLGRPERYVCKGPLVGNYPGNDKEKFKKSYSTCTGEMLSTARTVTAEFAMSTLEKVHRDQS